MLSTVFPPARFIPELLKGGDNTQLHLWNTTKGNSIYVKWIPDEMDEPAARYFFEPIGTVSRVEFVRHQNGKGRMMFLHFEKWATTQVSEKVRNGICEAHPAEYEYPVIFLSLTGADPKQFQLKCCVNMRPIPVVEYSINQLSDIVDIVDKRTAADTSRLLELINNMLREMAELRSVVKQRDSLITNMGRDIAYLRGELDQLREPEEYYDEYLDDADEINAADKNMLKHPL
jgi:hypothetical protein